MNPERYRGERDNAKSQIYFLKLVVAGLVLLLMPMAYAVAMLIGNVQVQVNVPPTINKSFWVQGKRANAQYLEEMGYFISQMVLTTSPESVDYQNKMLLYYACPSAYGKLKTDQAVAAEALKRDAIATVFGAHGVSTDEKSMQVALTGSLSTWVGARKAPDRPATYLAKFDYQNARICVADFKETSSDDPFGLKPARTTAQ